MISLNLFGDYDNFDEWYAAVERKEKGEMAQVVNTPSSERHTISTVTHKVQYIASPTPDTSHLVFKLLLQAAASSSIISL